MDARRSAGVDPGVTPEHVGLVEHDVTVRGAPDRERMVEAHASKRALSGGRLSVRARRAVSDPQIADRDHAVVVEIRRLGSQSPAGQPSAVARTEICNRRVAGGDA